MTHRGHSTLAAAALACAALRLVVSCSTSSGAPAPAQDDEAGPIGNPTSACEGQGYFDELDSGGCPEGTCVVRAFDTNGGALPCCTSAVSGPGMCLDGSATETGVPGDAGDAGDARDAGDASDGSAAADASDAGDAGDSSDAGGAGDAGDSGDASDAPSDALPLDE
ncbi:MAG TPA: hypothetical protein VIY73_15710 [Polyangiaceae bacterium]